MKKGLDTETILNVWEVGESRLPLDRAILLLGAAGNDAAADLPIAERDRALLALRCALFGRTLQLVAECPHCGTVLELSLNSDALDEGLCLPPPEPVGEAGGIVLRDPTSRDLAAISRAPDPVSALRKRLTEEDAGWEPHVSAIDAWIEKRIDATEIRLCLDCTACQASWPEVLDLPAHLWREVQAEAHRLLRDIAELARSFGWSERAILNLGSVRRDAYLVFARGG